MGGGIGLVARSGGDGIVWAVEDSFDAPRRGNSVEVTEQHSSIRLSDI